MRQLHGALKEFFIFSSCSDEEIDQIDKFASVMALNSGAVLFSEGDEASAFYAVKSGFVKIYKVSREGKEQIIHLVGPGLLVAEAAIFDIQRYPAHCGAIENSEVIKFPKKEFLELLRLNPQLSFKLLNAYSKKLRQLVSLIEDLSLNDVKTRVANFLIGHSIVNEGKMVCTLAATKKDVASHIGITPESWSRVIKEFKQKKLISEKENGRLDILKPEQMKSILQRNF